VEEDRLPRPKRLAPDGTQNPEWRPGAIRDERATAIRRGLTLGQISTADPDLKDALFLKSNPGWKPEDLGYPPRDYILIDLMRLMGKD